MANSHWSSSFIFQALTCIDAVTNLAEVIRINNKTSAHISMLFENNWLARYPRPSRCIQDNGGEFTGAAFYTCYVLMVLKMLRLQSKIHRLMPYVNDYINLLVIPYGYAPHKST